MWWPQKTTEYYPFLGSYCDFKKLLNLFKLCHYKLEHFFAAIEFALLHVRQRFAIQSVSSSEVFGSFCEAIYKPPQSGKTTLELIGANLFWHLNLFKNVPAKIRRANKCSLLNKLLDFKSYQ